MSEFIPFLFLSISIFAVYPVIFSNIKNMTEVAVKRETEQQNELLLLQIEKENLQMAADRMARHDRRHHNLVLLEFANKNDIETVKEYAIVSDAEEETLLSKERPIVILKKNENYNFAKFVKKSRRK